MNRILVLDENTFLLMWLEFLMTKGGFQVMLAQNGADAMDLIYAKKPDLLLMDPSMPDIDGFELCREIKRQPALRDIIVVFLTARDREIDIEKGLALGAARYILKPFSTRNLLIQVSELISAEGTDGSSLKTD